MFYIKLKTKSSCETFFSIYIEQIPTSYFGYSGHVKPLPSKTIIPSCGDFDVYLNVESELHS